jgi:CTP:phosphocholine cytidylyltransferase-like protein
MTFNIIISLAGRSQRFFNEGFNKPKFILPIDNGKTMIEYAIDTLNIPGQLILIVQKEHCEKYNIDIFLKEKYPTAIVRYLDYYTEGATQSCYIAAKDLIDNDSPLVISNCDQILKWNSSDFINTTLQDDVDGCVLTYYSDAKKNSFALTDGVSRKIISLAEKEVISNEALVGVHSWKHGSDFCRAAEYLFENNVRMNNEYYISISYNSLIKEGKSIHAIPLAENEGDKYWPTGIPSEYFDYLQEKFGSMKTSHLNDMIRGWLIGDFEPSIYRTKDFEIGYLSHPKGQVWAPHVHNKADEINVLIKGKMRINNEDIEEKEIFIVKKGMLTSSIFLEDCEILCIKIPSLPHDKICY